MSLTIITRALGSFAARHRPAAALVAASGVLFATAGSAAAYTANPIPLNAPTWSGNVCCGASAPGWYKDAFGIIHLQGAVTQTVKGGSPLIATLPPAARPNREVFTIVHTFAGTYADLAIAPSGQIGVIAPRPPAVQNFSFVSLEGITYQPANQLPATPIEINETNWTDTFTPVHPGFGATPAAWYKDGNGIVHLQGAADQFDAQPGGASQPELIGALPPAAAPTRDLFTVVHTAFGTYATLLVRTSGQLVVIEPPGRRSPTSRSCRSRASATSRARCSTTSATSTRPAGDAAAPIRTWDGSRTTPASSTSRGARCRPRPAARMRT